MTMKPLPYPTIEPKKASYELVAKDPQTGVPLIKYTPATLRMLMLTAMAGKP